MSSVLLMMVEKQLPPSDHVTRYLLRHGIEFVINFRFLRAGHALPVQSAFISGAVWGRSER